MLLSIEKNVFRAGSCLLRKFSLALESTVAPDHVNQNNNDNLIQQNEDFMQIRRDTDKSLRVAIIGLPNVGKSTLINRLVRRSICATASKCHVTRTKADAVFNHEGTQLVFIDTPGLVSAHEFKKFQLEDSFVNDSKKAMSSADIVGVVQDTSNKHTRGIIHKQILELLKMSRVGVPSVLILNKIDTIKNKRDLLGLVKSLTSEQGWPNFSDVFMVSALKEDGIRDLRNYLLDSAKPRDWDYTRGTLTDQPREKIIELAVRSKFMDCLPKELPYHLQIQIEHLGILEDGSWNAIVLVNCKSDRISKIVLGKGGRRVKTVALDAEQELSNAFRTTVRLKVVVVFDGKK